MDVVATPSQARTISQLVPSELPQPELPESARKYRANVPPANAILVAFEAILWIAFRRAIPFAQTYSIWRMRTGLEASQAEWATLAALEARGAVETGYCYCICNPMPGFEDSIPSKFHVLTKDGPKALRALRGAYRKQLGRLVSFREMAEIHFDNRVKDCAVSHHVKQAMTELILNIAAEKIVAHGTPQGSEGVLIPEKIPYGLFLIPAVKFTEWNSLNFRDLLKDGNGPIYSNVTFRRDDILRLWPAASVMPDVLGPPIQAQGNMQPNAAIPIERIERDACRTIPKRRGGKTYAEQDAPLIAEMERLIETGVASSPWEATDHVESKAAGGGSSDAKRKRLLAGFQKRSGLFRPERF